MSIVEGANQQENLISSSEGFKPLSEQLSSLKVGEGLQIGEQITVEQKADAELAVLIGNGEKKAVTPGQSVQVKMAKSQLNQARQEPHKIKSMVAASLVGQMTSSQLLRIAKNKRVLQGLANIGQNPQAHPHLFSAVATQSDDNNPLLKSLTTVIAGQSPSTDPQNSAYIMYDARHKFMKYMLTIMSQKDRYMASRLFAAYHFNDYRVFDQFAGLEGEMLLAYDRFLKVVNEPKV
jgi:hypothetical protein